LRITSFIVLPYHLSRFPCLNSHELLYALDGKH
jgi:hypothetical protein